MDEANPVMAPALDPSLHSPCGPPSNEEGPPLVVSRSYVFRDNVWLAPPVVRHAEELGPAELHAAEVLEPGRVTKADVRSLIPLLPLESFGTGKAFLSGVKREGKTTVVQPAMRLFPFSCQLLAKFVKQADCDFCFNSIAIFQDVSNAPPRDAMNYSEENLVIPISDFVGGQIGVRISRVLPLSCVKGSP